MKFLFCQFSTLLINKDNKKDIADKYYNLIWKRRKKDGYFKSRHFWELPLWIVEACGTLQGHFKKLFIITDIKKAIKTLNKSKTDFILFSVLDVNKNFILEIIKNYQGQARFIIGGYADLTEFKTFNNVVICESIQAMCEYLNIKYVYNLDYSLFKNYKTVPRLTLSTGCTNKCKFCSIEKQVKTFDLERIKKQVQSFKSLNFKLVYLNDKTFGQAGNYTELKNIYHTIKKYNPAFKGFIVQTTTAQFLNKKFVNSLKSLFVYAVELGIETYNNDLLIKLKKPQNTNTINNAISILKNLKIKIIPNLIIGIIGENEKTYNNTLNFLKKYLKDFFILNVYNLAIYENTELEKEVKTENAEDKNEFIKEKSFYNNTQLKANNYFYDNVFNLGLKVLA